MSFCTNEKCFHFGQEFLRNCRRSHKAKGDASKVTNCRTFQNLILDSCQTNRDQKLQLPNKVLDLIHKRVQKRPSKNDLNFNFIHQEDVFVIAELAYSMGIDNL